MNKLLRSGLNLATTATIGGVLGYVANKYGYDIGAVEGMKQSVLSYLPLMLLNNLIDRKEEGKDFYEIAKWLGNSPYLGPLVFGVLGAAIFPISGYFMEHLTDKNINLGFVTAVGGLDSLLEGMVASKASREKLPFISKKIHDIDNDIRHTA